MHVQHGKKTFVLECEYPRVGTRKPDLIMQKDRHAMYMIISHTIFQIIISLENWEENNKVALAVELSIYYFWAAITPEILNSEALIYLLDSIYIRFGTKLYRQIVGIPMGTNCAPLVADLFLFCYERDIMTSLSDVKQAEIIEAFKSTSRYLDDLLNIDNPYFEGMVNRIYPPELQLNKANTSDIEAPFFGFAFIYFKRICFI